MPCIGGCIDCGKTKIQHGMYPRAPIFQIVWATVWNTRSIQSQNQNLNWQSERSNMPSMALLSKQKCARHPVSHRRVMYWLINGLYTSICRDSTEKSSTLVANKILISSHTVNRKRNSLFEIMRLLATQITQLSSRCKNSHSHTHCQCIHQDH